MYCTNSNCILRTYENGLYCSSDIRKKCRDFKNEQLTINFE